MQTHVLRSPSSKREIIAGRILTGLVTAFMLFDGAIKVIRIQPVVESFNRLGWPDSVSVGIGLLELVIVALYVAPATAVLGAILLTGLLGGAVATHARIGDPLFSHIMFGVYVGVLAWAGIFLRNARLRALIPVER